MTFSSILIPSLYLILLTLLSFAISYIARNFIGAYIGKKLNIVSKNTEGNCIFKKLNQKISYLIIPFILLTIAPIIPQISADYTAIVQKISLCCIILLIATIMSSILDLTSNYYQNILKDKPVKIYIQIGKLSTFIVAGLLILATLLNQPPLLIISGLGAMLAIVILVFQDTILSLIAGIQISSTNIVKVGDWIEMPNLGADGEVQEILLHTIAVKNWDNTITIIPIRKLVTDSFKNWRNMNQSGARRIKRSLFIDQNTIRFLTSEELKELSKINYLKDYLNQKIKEIEIWNKNLGEQSKIAANTRRLTNLGTFRAYINNYLAKQNNLREDMIMLAKLQAPTAAGLPVEIYCFCDQTSSVKYEAVQADIFEHLYSIIEIFGLKIFQMPTGSDLRNNLQIITKKKNN
ncbi:mechanosensitive ion channel family protein [Bartonella sp. DGB1]|uniref:mechanosensitive ion channel family protein n=1 Tax=Bartonella sp. DGB1 TaxID=3239807 RepID=UPI0035265B3B